MTDRVIPLRVECPTCHGRGWLNTFLRCQECHGEGTVPTAPNGSTHAPGEAQS